MCEQVSGFFPDGTECGHISLAISLAVNQLPSSRQREMVELVAEQIRSGRNLNISEIANELGISQPACWELWQRALRIIRQDVDNTLSSG